MCAKGLTCSSATKKCVKACNPFADAPGCEAGEVCSLTGVCEPPGVGVAVSVGVAAASGTRPSAGAAAAPARCIAGTRYLVAMVMPVAK